MSDFVQNFRKTSYCANLIKCVPHEVMAIYLLGSSSSGIVDERSDYDIIILTNGGQFLDASGQEYITYKGKLVHWYYFPVEDLFIKEYSVLTLQIFTPIYLRNICEDLIIYENPKYKEVLCKIYENKEWLSIFTSYSLFSLARKMIDEILEANRIFTKHYSKWLYHLCLVSYYLTSEQPDVEFLKALKRIRYTDVSEEHKQLAIQRLRIYKDFIKCNQLEASCELRKMYEQLNTKLQSIIEEA